MSFLLLGYLQHEVLPDRGIYLMWDLTPVINLILVHLNMNFLRQHNPLLLLKQYILLLPPNLRLNCCHFLQPIDCHTARYGS